MFTALEFSGIQVKTPVVLLKEAPSGRSLTTDNVKESPSGSDAEM